MAKIVFNCKIYKRFAFFCKIVGNMLRKMHCKSAYYTNCLDGRTFP